MNLNQAKMISIIQDSAGKLHPRIKFRTFVLPRHSRIQLRLDRFYPIWNHPAIISLFLGVSLTSLVASVNFDSARYNPTLWVRRASITAANYGE
jgi:hypothetical protein